MMIGMIPAAGWLALFLVYLRGAAGTFTFEDSPELLACAATLGNAHEPGYPLLVLLDRLAMLLPVGTNAFRLNLLTAATAAGAAVLAGALATSVLRNTAPRPWIATCGGACTAALWGLSDAFWWQAGIGDKYPLLSLLFVGVLRTAWEGRIRTAALVFGLAVSHHPFGLFAAPAFGWAAWKGRKRAPLLLLLIALPLSLRFIYPPVRAVSDMNWGDPVTVTRLGRYLISGRYHESLREARGAPGGGLLPGAALGIRLLGGELTAPGLALAAVGLAGWLGAAPGFPLALLGCAACDVALAIQTPEKVVRWYAPLGAIAAVLAGIGFGMFCSAGPGRSRRPVVLAVAGLIAAGAWQGRRGWSRNDLSSFYAAHDMARNLLVSLPTGAIYLGRGDDDLFPLWAGRFGEGLRPDVEAVGMGTLVDVRPADAGGLRRLSLRTGFPVGGWDHLRWLLTSPRGIPVRYARTGYDDVLWTTARLDAQRSAGLTAAWTRDFDPAGSVAATRRALRGYRWRGATPRCAPATLDAVRPRDEVARDALLQPVHACGTLGLQLQQVSRAADARGMFVRATFLLEPFVGPLRRSGDVFECRAELARGFVMLAERWERSGVPPVAARFRLIADRLRTPVGK